MPPLPEPRAVQTCKCDPTLPVHTSHDFIPPPVAGGTFTRPGVYVPLWVIVLLTIVGLGLGIALGIWGGR